MLNIALFGPPGAGKGTQSEFLIKEYNLFYISTGYLLRKEIEGKTKLGMEAQEIIAKSVYDYFHNEENLKLIDESAKFLKIKKHTI